MNQVIKRQADVAMAPAIARIGRPLRTRLSAQPAQTTPAPSRAAIRAWMLRHVEEYRDQRTSEVNMTDLVQGWDIACADGGATLDSDHIAWEIAADVAEQCDGLR